jgi:hypothetical protein
MKDPELRGARETLVTSIAPAGGEYSVTVVVEQRPARFRALQRQRLWPDRRHGTHPADV